MYRPSWHISFSHDSQTTALFNIFQSTVAAKGQLHIPSQGPTDVLPATIPLIFIFYFFYDMAYTPMLVAYTLEILPYKIRARGFAVMVSQMLLTIGFV